MERNYFFILNLKQDKVSPVLKYKQKNKREEEYQSLPFSKRKNAIFKKQNS